MRNPMTETGAIKQGEVGIKLEELQKSCNLLGECITQLRERLQPVIVEVPEKPSSSCPRVTPSCTLARILDDITCRVDSASNLLSLTREEIQL